MNQEDILKYKNEISKNKKNFQKYNITRLQKFTSSISNKSIIDLIDALPILIGDNQLGLPGYVNNFEPLGIYGYTPTERALHFIRTWFPTVHITNADNNNPLIEVFAIMGSAGSIAYNEESDIDFWICLDENRVGLQNINSLMNKLREIELWITENFNIETHFYLNDITKIRSDLFDTSEDSFSGKANGKLLKDEFYRSSILLSGKIPFWWVVPSGIDDKVYYKYLKVLDELEFNKDYVDFGNLYHIDKGDFLGGGIFQILKSLGNPFKSIIKIGIMERYLSDEDGENPLLCNIIKQNVQNVKLDMNHIDPYILMFNQVHDYYTKNINDNNLMMSSEILRMCFYIKIDPYLSKYSSSNPHDKKSQKIIKMSEYVRSWQWSKSKIEQMDNFRNWDITPINKFWNNITKQILNSYKRILSNIESQKLSQKFSNEEIKFITRKIHSSFSLSGNKIRQAVSFKDNPIEKNLIIESINKEGGEVSWLLSKGFKSGKGGSERLIIHKEPALIALLAWISMNRMFQKDYSRVDIKSRYHLLDSGFVRELMNELTLHFSIKRLNIQNKYFFDDPFPLLNFIIINLYSKYPKGIDDIFYLYHNSWGETIYEKYNNEIDISNILVKLLNGALNNRDDFERCVWLTSPSPYKSSKSFKGIKSLFKETYDLFISRKFEEWPEKRYITILGNNYTVFSFRKLKGKDKIISNVYDSELKMLYSLSNIIGRKNIIHIDPRHPELNYLRLIIDNYKEDTIQIYYQKERKYCYFFVSDEQGSIIFYRENSDRFIDYLTRLYIFSKNVISQVVKNNPNSSLGRVDKNIEIYELVRDVRNKCSITEKKPELEKNIFELEKMIMPFRISLEILDDREIGYRFSLPYGGETSPFKRSDTSKVAKDMLVYMDSVKGYNYYVTDVDLTALDLEIYKKATSFSFAEKNRFELVMESHLYSIKVE
ncbi:MAG: class I adenylate cyclase [Spirochaetota bacterium]|nr:class I adenylate cyclase [Spirochaetota bacterium]